VIWLSLTLLGFGIVDLLRWSPDPVHKTRARGATVATALGIAAVGALAGFGLGRTILVGIVTLIALWVWTHFDYSNTRRPGYPLAWALLVLVSAFAAAGSGDGVSGPLERWYSNLPFRFAESITVNQFLLGLSAGLFLLATTNRVVTLVLDAAGTPVADNESVLSGGRLLGPMERLLVAAMVLAGDLTGATIVIAAKGFLRLPEIRDRDEKREGKDDQVTEYFLIGTFCSLLIAGALAGVVLGSG
jgi:hypothetical protein